ncbi:MAG: succinate dehydrogenase, cytochrome b556 subunit [Rhodobacterales bacterium]|nr:MAG: succinate dehydrogenase, cytochrome b556 subunit [Rhodobacterales bacterium]
MADVERGNRPLSPHLDIYKLPLNAIVSILHRATGAAVGGVVMLLALWFLGAAWSEPVFNALDWLLTSWLGWLVLLGATAALWLHYFNGIRHLIWDTGAWFGKKRVARSAKVTIAAAGTLTLATLIVAIVW